MAPGTPRGTLSARSTSGRSVGGTALCRTFPPCVTARQFHCTVDPQCTECAYWRRVVPADAMLGHRLSSTLTHRADIRSRLRPGEDGNNARGNDETPRIGCSCRNDDCPGGW